MKLLTRARKKATSLGIRFMNRYASPAWRRYVFRYFDIFRGHPRFFYDSGETVVAAGIYLESTVQDILDAVGPKGKLVCIEANPDNVKTLHAAFSNQSNIYFVNQAVWNEQTTVNFMVSETSYQGWARVDHPEISDYPLELDATGHNIEVKADTIDNMLAELGVKHVDHIHMTINDAQVQALDGMGETIRSNPGLRLFISSQHPDPADKVTERLKKHGFKMSVRPHIPYNKPPRKGVDLVHFYAYGATNSS